MSLPYEEHGMLSPHDNNTADWYPLLEMFSKIDYSSHLAMAIIMCIIFVMAVTGNLTVIGVFLGSAKLRTPSNMLIVNLAFGDLLMAISSFPLLIHSSIQGSWAYSLQTCHFYGATATMFGLMSINTLVFISLDRLIVISSPQHMIRITYTTAACCVAVAWIYSAVWAVMPLLGWNRYIIEGYGTTCSIDYFTRVSPHRHFLLVMFLADYIFPCLIITCCYILIYTSVRKHLSLVNDLISQGRERPKPKWSAAQLKIARTCFMVVVLYCVTWTPYAVVVLIGQYGNASHITPTNSMLPAVFAKLSTISNPILYAISHPYFREACHSILLRLNILKASDKAMSLNTESSRSGMRGRGDEDGRDEDQPMIDIQTDDPEEQRGGRFDNLNMPKLQYPTSDPEM